MTAGLAEIEQLDSEVIYLLARRFERARDLALLKKNSAVRVIDHERELSTLERVFALSSEHYAATSIVAVFRRILEESRAVELKATTNPDQLSRERSAGSK